MKCNSRIYYWANKKKKNGKPSIHTIVSVRGRSAEEISWIEKSMNELSKNVDPNFDICDGDIIGEIVAVEEPYMGGVSASLEVNYRCTKCSCNNYKDLPNQYSLETWFNDWLNKNE